MSCYKNLMDMVFIILLSFRIACAVLAPACASQCFYTCVGSRICGAQDSNKKHQTLRSWGAWVDAAAANGLRTVHFLTKSEPLDTTLPPTLKLLAPSLRHACAHMLVTFFEAKAWRTQAKEDKLRTLPKWGVPQLWPPRCSPLLHNVHFPCSTAEKKTLQLCPPT